VKIALPETAPADPQALAALRELAVSIYARAKSVRDAFQSELKRVSDEVTNRYKSLDGVSAADKHRMASAETSARTTEARKREQDAMNKLLRELAPVKAKYDFSRPYYQSRLAYLDRVTLASERRATCAANLAHAGPVALHNAAVRAMQAADADLAAAVVSRLDGMSAKDRPFGASDVAERVQVPGYEQAIKALNETGAAIDGTILLTRVARDAGYSPIAKIAAALRTGAFPVAADGAIELQGTE